MDCFFSIRPHEDIYAEKFVAEGEVKRQKMTWTKFSYGIKAEELEFKFYQVVSQILIHSL